MLAVATASGQSSGAGAAQARGGWLQQALGLQYKLANDVGMRNAPWIGTHNSFNSTAEMGQTLSDQDSNQKLAISDQLDLGVRSLELDVHWFFSLQAGGLAPVVCHARPGSEAHAGCSIEKPLGTVLDEIASWLRRQGNRRQVLLLYMEDHLDNQAGYDAGASAVARHLDDLLYRPPGDSCRRLPRGLSRKEVLAAGKQAVIVSDCGIGSDWPGVVFDWSSHEEEGPGGFTDFPDCGSDFRRAEFDARLIRYFEDSTQLSAATSGGSDRITPKTSAQMARCGVDLLGLDQLTPDDARLPALVWSWAVGQPGPGRCAVQRRVEGGLDTPWRTRSCARLRRPACRQGERWLIGTERIRQRGGRAACAGLHAQFAVPRTGYDAQLLRLAMERRGAREVWLGYRKRKSGGWAALDRHP
jgi:hypothetical protein